MLFGRSFVRSFTHSLTQSSFSIRCTHPLTHSFLDHSAALADKHGGPYPRFACATLLVSAYNTTGSKQVRVLRAALGQQRAPAAETVRAALRAVHAVAAAVGGRLRAPVRACVRACLPACVRACVRALLCCCLLSHGCSGGATSFYTRDHAHAHIHT